VPQASSSRSWLARAGLLPREALLRPRDEHQENKVTNIELFFDLVFVYAVTQLSHALLHQLNLLGALQVLLLFLAVWWVWVFTTWVTNWLDPERPLVRVALLTLMLAGLLLSIAIPNAFGERGMLFAGAYVFMQVGRTLFMLWAIGDAAPANTRNFQRIAVWLVVSGVLWLIGGRLDGQTRGACWSVALLLEYLGPAMAFRVPGLGRSSTADWNVDGGHLAERCSQFVIIALGESSVDLIVRGWVHSADFWTTKTDLLRAFKEHYDQAGISMPFPQRELTVVNGALPDGANKPV
jgi:low temperature requirement protein LtrA